MAEELLDQVRDIAEGQIVCSRFPEETRQHNYKLLTHCKQDFEGQKLAELLSTALLSLAGVCHPTLFPLVTVNTVLLTTLLQFIAFVVGYFLQDIKLAVFIALGGTALTFLIVIPPWPFYNKNPVKWLPVGGSPAVAVPQTLVIDEKAIR